MSDASSGGDTAVSSHSQHVFIVAIDTSGSAKEHHEELFNRAKRHIVRLDRKANLIMFRFDSKPAEVYSGTPPGDEADAGRILKRELQSTSATRGTNLRRLLEAINASLNGIPPARIDIFTDCGTELMSQNDEKLTRDLAADFGNAEIAFHGVQSGFRERLRKIFSPKQIVID